MAIGSYLSIITLNINGLNAPTKRQRLAEWIQKQDPYICCLQETHLKTRDTYRLKVKGWKKIFHANRDQKKAGVAILISDKIDFKTKAVKRDKEGHYIMIKGSIQEEDINYQLVLEDINYVYIISSNYIYFKILIIRYNYTYIYIYIYII